MKPRVMGIDYGTARIGGALPDELHMPAHPTETIPVATTPNPAARIAATPLDTTAPRSVSASSAARTTRPTAGSVSSAR